MSRGSFRFVAAWLTLLAACGSGNAGAPDTGSADVPEPTDVAPPDDTSAPPDARFDAVFPDTGADPGTRDLAPEDPSPDPTPSDLPPTDSLPPEDPGTDPGGGSDLPADPGPPAGPCESAGGLCVLDSRTCQQGGGTLHPAGDAQCLFDDGPLFCCIPPIPQASGETCASRGGLCVTTPGVCYRTGGIHAPRADDCPPGPGSMCCLPADRCPPGDDLECCMGSWTARPMCDRGTWTCLDGGDPQPKGSCLPD
ncbi:MAG TPA: hypothetical protein PLQ97_11800 [Myxococcota bacterium]|nr:hypothetical protein [Myxococcota bacterium]HQK51443.1 hypothetical protein [Myxococcota bacterium]